MEWGLAIIRATAFLAVGCYLMRTLGDISGLQSVSASRWKRGLWTLGALVLLLHIAAAFHFVHHWSHAAAERHTAEQTAQVTGWYWGGGMYFNYAFAGLWLMDAIFWWRGDASSYPRSRTTFWTIHAGFALMMFNATVVFGPAYWQMVFGVFTLAALLVFWTSRGRQG